MDGRSGLSKLLQSSFAVIDALLNLRQNVRELLKDLVPKNVTEVARVEPQHQSARG